MTEQLPTCIALPEINPLTDCDQQLWIPVAPGITYESLPEPPDIFDTTPDAIIGCIANIGLDPQGSLNSAFPLAIQGDGVIQSNNNHVWLYDGSSTWVDIGSSPGPTILVDKVIARWNERLHLMARSKTKLLIESKPYAIALLSNVLGKTRTLLSIRQENAGIPISSIIYSQSSVYSSNTPATNENMTDDDISGTATGTEDGPFEWVKLDMGGAYDVDRIVIGTATTAMPGGWDKSNTENLDIQYSLDDTNWTVGGNTGTFPAEGIYELSVSFNARYIRLVQENNYLGLMEFYPLALNQSRVVYGELMTGPIATYLESGILPGEPYSAIGTLAPTLGATQVTPTTVATNAGWALIFDGSRDEGANLTSAFGFDFTLNEVAYNTCYVNSNAYLTFGTNINVYDSLNALRPACPKIFFGPDDWSVQRIYTKAETNIFRIRWEGNSDYSAPVGSSNRFAEITFYAPRADGTQFVEIRSGNLSGILGQVMIASATTSFATTSFAANQSWVLTGNNIGTQWLAEAGNHIELLPL